MTKQLTPTCTRVGAGAGGGGGGAKGGQNVRQQREIDRFVE